MKRITFTMNERGLIECIYAADGVEVYVDSPHWPST